MFLKRHKIKSSAQQQIKRNIASYKVLFCLIFVSLFLYLLGDAFYRWDGFSYYASFLEFLPAVALISVLWSIVAVIASIIVWLLYKLLYWICKCFKLKILSEHVFLNTCLLISFGAIVWTSKKLIWPDPQTTPVEKLILVVSVTLLSVLLTWQLRNKAELLLRTLFEHLSPLIWLFVIIVGLSLPLVIFYALREPVDKTILSVAARPSEADGDRPNIVLVTYDALTSKDMSVYGYHRLTTPFISAWAKSATVFSKCEASANITSSTVASLMTGKRVWSHRRYQSDAGKPAKAEVESLPLLLRDSGYYNMAFIANDIASVQKLGMSGSFHVKPPSSETMEPASLSGLLHKKLIKYFGAEIKLYDWILKDDFILGMLLNGDYFKYPFKTEHPVKKVFDMFLSELNKNTPQPFFAWIHLYPPHAPYLPPEPYIGMFDPSPEFRTARSQYTLINPRYYTPEQQPEADIIRSRYDEFIRYCDKQFEYFIKQLSLNNKFKNTVIILSSDHGESFERGYLTHGSHFLFEEMTHIPLIIKEPIQNVGRIIDFPVEQTDIPATILDLAHIPVPLWMDGHSLGPLLQGKQLDPKPVFSMSMEEVRDRGEISKGIFAVWEGDYKLIHYITSKETLLFNLNDDPHELNNLFASEFAVGQRLLSIIQDNLAVNEGFSAKE